MKTPIIPKRSFRETLDITNSIKKNILTKIREKFNLIDLDVPLVTEIGSEVNDNSLTHRRLNFDNKTNAKIYELIVFPDNLIRYNSWWIGLENNDCLFTQTNFIDRDGIDAQSDRVDYLIWNFEFLVREEERNEYNVTKHLNIFWEAIIDACLEIKNLSGIKNYQNVQHFSFKSLSKKYFLSSPRTLIYKFMQDKTVVSISEIFQKDKSLSSYLYRPTTAYDLDNSAAILSLDKNIDNILNLVELTIRPNWEIYSRQNQILETQELNDFEKILKQDTKPLTASVKINITNILYFLLDKQKYEELPLGNSDFSLTEIYKFYKK